MRYDFKFHESSCFFSVVAVAVVCLTFSCDHQPHLVPFTFARFPAISANKIRTIRIYKFIYRLHVYCKDIYVNYHTIKYVTNLSDTVCDCISLSLSPSVPIRPFTDRRRVRGAMRKGGVPAR